MALAALALCQASWGALAALDLGCAVLLLTAAFRTLRRLSGGLRLLGGAWGLVAGMALERLVSLAAPRHAPLATLALAAVSLAGLALTVLHKEK